MTSTATGLARDDARDATVIAHLRLEGSADDADRARRFVAEQLAGLPEPDIDSAMLVTGELVGNAALQTGARVTLGLSRSRGRVLIAIADDPHVRRPQRVDPDQLAQRGRGFEVVASEASDFGWRLLDAGAGKVLWAVLDTHAMAAAG